MKILGIDPGTATTGYGVIKISKNSYSVVDWGLIETDKEKRPEKRLNNIFIQTSNVIKKYSPDVMVIEKLFFATNAKTVMRVGQAHGAMMVAAAKNNVSVIEYAPGTIKKTVSGNGRADKKMIQKSVRGVLGARVRSKKRKKTHFDNAADALAVAICHAKLNSEKGGDL